MARNDTGAQLMYSVRQAVEAVGLSRSTLYQLMAEGEVEFAYYGSKRLIPAESLRAFAKRLMDREAVR